MIPWLSIVLARASDIPTLVEGGAVDLGVTGYDYVVESGAEVAELLDLEFGGCRIVLAAPEESGIESPRNLTAQTRIATKYPSIAGNYLKVKGMKAKIVKVSGAVEITPLMNVAEAVLDIVDTGATLKIHGLRIVEEVLRSSARLIVNKKALAEKGEKIKEITTALRSVLMARKKKLLMMNVPEEALQRVLGVLPSMGGPTLAKVEAPVPMWEVYSVVEEGEIPHVISSVKTAGARDIIVLPVERVVP